MNLSDLSPYTNLASLSSITELTENPTYIECPDNWFLVISDIAGSTKAVKNGKYRDVNLCGAAIIALLTEKLQTRNFPFVFGGDGSTILLPPSLYEACKEDFTHLIYKVEKDFGLNLRIGALRYSDIKAKGHQILISKLKLSNGNSLAQFTGSGVSYGEKLIKQDSTYLLNKSENLNFNLLNKLSCRFAPLKSTNGKILTFIVSPLVDVADPEFTKLVNSLKPFLAENKYRPISTDIKLDPLYKLLLKQYKVTGTNVKQLFFAAFAWLCGVLNVKAIVKYFEEVPQNSDYQKFDGLLRAVIDCSENEINYILETLTDYQNKKIILFGHQISENAVTTCIIDNINDNNHIHFIDGDGGGYTLAAAVLKAK